MFTAVALSLGPCFCRPLSGFHLWGWRWEGIHPPPPPPLPLGDFSFLKLNVAHYTRTHPKCLSICFPPPPSPLGIFLNETLFVQVNKAEVLGNEAITPVDIECYNLRVEIIWRSCLNIYLSKYRLGYTAAGFVVYHFFYVFFLFNFLYTAISAGDDVTINPHECSVKVS